MEGREDHGGMGGPRRDGTTTEGQEDHGKTSYSSQGASTEF